MHAQPEPRDPRPEKRLDREQRTTALKVGVGLIIAVLFLIFVVQNARPVTVDFVFFATSVPLVWVFLVCALIGALVAWLVGRPRRRAMRRLIAELERRQRGQG